MLTETPTTEIEEGNGSQPGPAADDQNGANLPIRRRKGAWLSRVSQRVARYLFQLRYGILVWCIGARSPHADLSRKGIVIVQVDALGHHNLQEALARGYMPYLKRLAQDPSFKLGRWRVGIPCDTPPVQSALMYGENEDVVGFYWMEKETGRRVSCANPFSVREVEDEMAGKDWHSIFAKGSTYGSIFAGKAFRSVMTVNALHPETIGKRLGIRHLLLFALLNPLKTLAIFGNAAWDVILELTDRLIVILLNRRRRREGFMTLSRIFLNVIFREATSIGTRIDMYLGTPVIYAVFLGYDLVAHHSGPLSPNSLRTLKGIDGCLRKIDRVRSWCERDYDLYVLSDHGMTPSIPFGQAYGKTLTRYVTEIADSASIDPNEDPAEYHSDNLFSFLKDLRQYEPQVSPPLVPILRLVGTMMKRWLKVSDQSQQAKVIAVGCSPLAHVYLREPKRRLNLSEVEELCPELLPALRYHEGIGLVIGKEGDDVVILSKKGQLILGRERIIIGEYPLTGVEEPELAEEQINRYARMNKCGDLILFGAMHGDDVICFENQLGSHGTLGGDQYYAFMLYPSSADLRLDEVTEARGLHLFFRRLVNQVD